MRREASASRVHEMLTERRAQVLRLIVADYIDSATPIGSEQIVRRHRLEISPATIRNEMARLEEDGFISHPHTSAGRVPSDLGYRYFVEMLMDEPSVSNDEQRRILHQFHQASLDISEQLRLAASVLAQSLHSVAIVSAPRSMQPRLKHLDLISLHDYSALLVVVLEEVKVRQQVLALAEPATRDDLTRLARRLDALCAGKTAAEITAAADGLNSLEQQIARLTAEIVQGEEQAEFPDLHREGLRNILIQPEFARSDKALDIFDALEERNIARALPQSDDAAGVTVVIGAENREEALRDCSVVLAQYSAAMGASGVVAIIGPTRLPYAKAIATVRYVGSLMTQVMDRLYE